MQEECAKYDFFRIIDAGISQDAVENIDGQVGIQYKAIPNATIGIEYESGNLLKSPLPLGFAYVFISLNY